MHSVPTQTIGVRKLWFWLALPLFTAGGVMHAAARLLSLEVPE